MSTLKGRATRILEMFEEDEILSAAASISGKRAAAHRQGRRPKAKSRKRASSRKGPSPARGKKP